MNKIKFGRDSTAYKLLETLGPFGFIAIKDGAVNLDDLIRKPIKGKIVRCYGNPDDCIKIYTMPNTPILECIAGWISEDV